MPERNRLGQYSTPSPLARQIVASGLSLLPKGDVSFLDPAFGTGAFFSALLSSLSPSSNLIRARGIEIDPHYGKPSRAFWKDSPIDIELCDFTALEPKPKYNLVVCNPPYIRHHHIDSATKKQLGRTLLERLGIKLSGLSGMYCYFLLLCDSWLSSDGIGCWLIPSEFMDVNYGVQLKRYLRERVQLIQIHRFCAKDLQFDDALVTSAIVFFRKCSAPAGHSVRLTFGGTITEPERSVSFLQNELKPEEKWNNFFIKKKPQPKPKLRLGDFFAIKRGIATGKNSFFILDESQACSLQIPKEFLRPILPSPRALKLDVIPCRPDGTPSLANPLFLLDCSLPEERIQSDFPLLWSYLQKGAAVSQGYLCRKRSPWYKQETRTAAPILCTYMGRASSRKPNPFKFILNRSNAIMTNVYLGLYPKPVLMDFRGAVEEVYQVFWKHLKNLEPQSLMDEGRVYGGGLHKLEPRELAQVPVPNEVEQFMSPAEEQLVLF